MLKPAPPMPPEDRTTISEDAPPAPTMSPGNPTPATMPQAPVDREPAAPMATATPLLRFAGSVVPAPMPAPEAYIQQLTKWGLDPSDALRLAQQIAFLGMGQKPATGPQMREGEVVGPNGYTASEMARMGLKPGDAVPAAPASPAPAPAPAAPAPGAGTNPTGLGTRKQQMQQDLEDIAKGKDIKR